MILVASIKRKVIKMLCKIFRSSIKFLETERGGGEGKEEGKGRKREGVGGRKEFCNFNFLLKSFRFCTALSIYSYEIIFDIKKRLWSHLF